MDKHEILEKVSKVADGTEKEYLSRLIMQLEEAKKKITETCRKDNRSETFIKDAINSFNESIVLAVDAVLNDNIHPTVNEIRKLTEI